MIETFKAILKILLIIIEKAGPTVATIVAVFLAYRYAKKQKMFENKGEDYKKIRKVSSNLLQIWREISVIDFYISSEDIYARMIFKDSKLASMFFQMDLARMEKFKQLLYESKEELKSINVALFYSLDQSFQEFDRSFNYFVQPEEIKKNQEKDLKEFLENVLKAVVRSLEDIIKDTAKHLPEIERKEIEKIVQNHHNELKKTDFDSDVPKFLVNIINKLVPTIEPINGDEIKILTNDHTVKMLVGKFVPHIIPLFMRGTVIESLSNAFTIIKNPESLEGKIDENDILLNLEISDDENRLLQNNLGFYKYICAIHKKFKSPIPMEFKRGLIKLNNGTVNIKRELEAHKAKIKAEQNS